MPKIVKPALWWIVCLIWLFSGPYQSFASAPDTLSSDRATHILADSIPALQQCICKHPAELWEHPASSHPIFTNLSSRERVWLRFPLKNTRPYPDTLFIEATADLHTGFYVFTRDGTLLFADTIGIWPEPSQPFFSDDPTVGILPLPANSDVLVYIQNEPMVPSSPRLQIRLYDKASIYQYFYQYQFRRGIQTLINTLSLGFLAFMFLFFLFYAIAVKQTLYTLYSLYLLMALAFCLTMWNELPYHAQAFMYSIFGLRYLLNETAVAWMFAVYILFADKLLNMSSQSRWFGYFLQTEVVLLFVYGVIHLVVKAAGAHGAFFIMQSYFYFRVIFMPFYIFIILFILFRIRSPLKIFFLIANIFLLAGVVSSIIIDYQDGVWHVRGSDVHPGALLQAGIIGETILFSLALGYNNILIHRQRDEHRKQYIEQLQENNRLIENERQVLAQRVATARQEILAQQQQIEARKVKQLQAEFDGRIQELTLQSLEAQMNPHFLFNGLSAVRDLVLKNKNDEAMQYINTFALLLRTSLINNRKPSITLQEELEATTHYLQIEKLRFGDDFRYAIKIEGQLDLTDIEVPPKLLQPVAENAVKHGLRHSLKNEKRITIIISTDAKRILVRVEDNGIGLRASQIINARNALEGTHLGLKLMKERLDVFNQQHGTHITMDIKEILTAEQLVEGTCVSIYILEEHDVKKDIS